MRRRAVRILIVVSAVLLTAWLSTVALIWLELSALSGASFRINPLLPHRATVSVRYVENGNAVTGLLKLKGLHFDSGEWWNNGNVVAEEDSGMSSFTGSSQAGLPGVSTHFESDNAHSLYQWSFGNKPILRARQIGVEPILHGVLPQLAGYLALILAWRRRPEPNDGAGPGTGNLKPQLLWAYGWALLAVISGATFAYCSINYMKLPALENASAVMWLAGILLSLTSALHVIRGGRLLFSLSTLPLCLAFSGVVTFWLMRAGIL